MNFRYFNRFALTSAASAIVLSFAVAPAAAQETVDFDIKRQPLARALLDFSEQSGLTVAAPSDLMNGKTSPAVEGDMGPTEALDRLLAGSGLKLVALPNGALTIVMAEAESRPLGTKASLGRGAASRVQLAQLQDRTVSDASPATLAQDEAEADADREKRQATVIVTGTTIRGVVPASAPVLSFDVSDIQSAGVVSVEEFFATLPQNFNGRSGEAFGATAGSSFRSSPNLRGLGDGATLVLLNGRRMVAPGGSTPDLSFLPLNALERVDVLTDGASAIYGGDAIAGVINFVLKDEFQAPVTELYYGAVGEGDHARWGFGQTGGLNWESGSLMAAYSYKEQSQLDAEDRDFARAAAPFELVPDSRTNSGVLSLRQDLGSRAGFFADALYSQRNAGNALVQGGIFTVFTDNSTEQTQLSTGAYKEFAKTWRGEVFVVASLNDDQSASVRVLNGDVVAQFDVNQNSTYYEAGGKLDGEIITLPAGAVRASFGAGYAEEDYETNINVINVRSTNEVLSRDSAYLFAETFVPLVSPDMGVPLVHALELTAAARFTDYSDLGSDTVPRVGVAWSPVEQLRLRSSYSESFRAPSLRELGGQPFIQIFQFVLGGDTTPTRLILNEAGPPAGDIRPESSDTFSAGFDWSLPALNGWEMSGTYFRTKFDNRLGKPDPTGGFAALSDPAAFGEFFIFDPTPAQVADLIGNSPIGSDSLGLNSQDPAVIAAGVDALVDLRSRNLLRSEVEGFDFTLAHTGSLGTFDTNASLNAAYIFDSKQQATQAAGEITTVDIVTQPVDLRLRGSLGVGRNAWTANAVITYVDDTEDRFAATPASVDSWTVLDLNASYTFAGSSNAALEGLKLGLGVRNVFDTPPPEVERSALGNQGLTRPIGYDPTNASPLGRFFQLRLTKEW
ncbi:TonB-dependent receptor [Hyphomonas oceanitis]|uniref:TonB-dependent receptor n=1 Tax=Hyphomonas oceanitis SCH89 TaxID=1280953 RepID=A0A059G1X2_9PROT|nr:TonB-dependent receptor [Hyphomonas oceanitis]KDA00739.1 TonB-dependent receptor [Hyphomonas oceanitis SCH89]|tara:strand:+ start:422 stop:3133 length:2712 start_codon:yes stop_codon:yes gene_type:complete